MANKGFYVQTGPCTACVEEGVGARVYLRVYLCVASILSPEKILKNEFVSS